VGQCVFDPDSNLTLQECQQQGCQRQRFSCQRPEGVCVRDDDNGPYTDLAQCESECLADKYTCDPDTFTCLLDRENGEFDTLPQCQDVCQPPPTEEYPTVFQLVALDPSWEGYEGTFRWTDFTNCDRPVFLMEETPPLPNVRTDFYYNRHPNAQHWKLNSYGLGYQLEREAPCFDLQEVAYGFSNDFQYLRHPINRQKVMEIVPLSYRSSEPKLEFNP
jgi:hypothetical protein